MVYGSVCNPQNPSEIDLKDEQMVEQQVDGEEQTNGVMWKDYFRDALLMQVGQGARLFLYYC